MVGLAITLLIVGIALLLVGAFVQAAQFLLWVGAVIVIVAIIAGLMRVIRK